MPGYGGPEAGMPAGGPAGPWYGTAQQGHPQQGNQYYPAPQQGPFPGGPPPGQQYGQHPFGQQPFEGAPGNAGPGPAGPGPWFRGDQGPGGVSGPYGDGFAGQGPGGFAGPWPGAGFVPGPGDPAAPGFAGPGAFAGGPPGYPPPGQFPGPPGQGQGSPGGPYQGGPAQAGSFGPGQQQGPPGQVPPGYHAAGRAHAGPPVAGQFAPPGQFTADQAFHEAAPAAQFAPGWTGAGAPGPAGQGAGGGSFPAGHGGQGGPLPGGPWPGDGQAGNARPGPRRQIDDDPDRVLTPTTIFAPGSLVSPPDGAEGDRRDSHPFAGPGGAPPGYGPFPGQGPWPAPGGYPQPGQFPGPGAAPGPGNAGGGFAGPGGYPPQSAPAQGTFPGPGGFAERGPFPPGTAFPVPGGFPANDGTTGGAGYGAPGYPAPGYGPPRFDHPYPGPGGVPFPDAARAAQSGVPGAAGYGPPPGPQFPGQPGMPPGYGPDPGQGPRQQAPGWQGQDGFPPQGYPRGPGGQPYPGGPGPGGPGQAGYASPGYPGPGAFPGHAGPPPGQGYPGPAAQPGAQGGQHAFPGQEGYPMAGGFAGPQAPYAEYQAWQPHGAPGGLPGPDGYVEMVNGGDYAYVIRQDDPAGPPSRPDPGGQGLGGWTPADPGTAPGRAAASGGQPSTASSAGAGASAGSAQAGRVRAITSGTVAAGWQARADARREAVSAEGPSTAPGPTALAGAATTEPATQADTAIPAGPRPRPEAAPEIDPALAYGPDDPAYGPPGPDWYKRDEERAARTGDGESPAAAGEPVATRGPFEPLRPGDREGAGHTDYQQADGDAAFDRDAGPLESDVSEYEPIDYEMSELLDLGTPTDPEAGALGQIRDLYQAAETVSQASLDRHFDQLLERQRELISEFFTESGGLGAAAAPVAPADASSSPLGFDPAESLTGLRGELRGAQ